MQKLERRAKLEARLWCGSWYGGWMLDAEEGQNQSKILNPQSSILNAFADRGFSRLPITDHRISVFK
jgi:hypothetical protein